MMDQSVRAANRAAIDFRSQSQAWSELRGKIKNDTSTYDALRSQLAEVQRLQEDEIVRLKRMLDDATKPSIYVDLFNLGLAFFLGILSSIVASGIYDAWKSRKPRKG